MGFKFIKDQIFFEIAMKSLAVACTSYFAVKIYFAYQAEQNIILLLMLLAEVITMFLIVVAKFTKTRDLSVVPSILTVCASFYFFAISLNNGIQVVPPYVSVLLMISGIFFQIFSKIYLGRSFGLLPACRTIVDTGPYKIIRHPIYFGYFITHIGFLLNQFSLYNLLVLTVLYMFQFGRMYYEERILSQSEEYQTYKRKVSKRFIPFII